MGSEFWVPRIQVGSGLAFSWVHTGPSLAVLAFDQTELLFSVPRTAAASLWALESGPGWGKGSGSFQEIPWGVLLEADFLFLVCGGIDGMAPGVCWSPRTTKLLQVTWSNSLGREAT